MKTTTLHQEIEKNTRSVFTRKLLSWNKAKNKRSMPWKWEKDPYRIWLSEIILQQTRVEQGWKYYENFISCFPDVASLAAAPEEKVFKLWEGLGYYSRCRNLIATAKIVVEKHEGAFPSDYDSIIALKGIGSYTAAAIASFAYNLPFAVVDGNVYRVLSRIFGIAAPTDTAQGKKLFATLAAELLPKNKSAEHNQAIMDFGATVCKPVPVCSSCLFKTECFAYQHQCITRLPVKSKTQIIKKRWLHYVIFEENDRIAIRQRTEKDIWQNLHEFYLIESNRPLKNKAVSALLNKNFGWSFPLALVAEAEQKLTHQQLYIQYFHCRPPEDFHLKSHRWVAKAELRNYAFPKGLKAIVEEYIATD